MNYYFIFILSFFTLTPLHSKKTNESSKKFRLVISKNIINKKSFKALLLSDEIGNVVYTFLKKESIEKKENFLIEIDNQHDNEMTLTLIYRSGRTPFMYSYVNIKNESYIDKITNSPQRQPFDQVNFSISGIEDIEYIEALSHRRGWGPQIKLEKVDNGVTFTFPTNQSANRLFRLRQIDQENYTYFELNKFDLDVDLSIDDLSSQTIYQNLLLPHGNFWEIDLSLTDSTLEENISLIRKNIKEVDEYEFEYPAIKKFPFLKLALTGNEYEFYRIYSEIPEEIIPPESDLVYNYSDGTGFSFSCEDEDAKFYVAQYSVPFIISSKKSKAKKRYSRPRSMAFKWSILGAIQDSDFLIPEWTDDLIEFIPELKKTSDPLNFRIKIGKLEKSISEKEWLNPYLFFNKEWKLQNELTIYSEIFSLKD